MSINVLQPSPSVLEEQAIIDALRSRWWGQGPMVKEFERQMAKRYGVRHCVTTNSATAALHLALLVSGVGPGDEVIVPALTFVSTALVVTYCGARPVFIDVDPHTLTLDWQNVSRHVTDKTKAVIPVDYAGYPAGRGTAWPVVQDAAHSCGGTAYGDMTCLSFHPVKNLGTGDGGAILLNDDAKAERLRRLRWCGIDESTYERTGRRYKWDYDIQEVGYKCHWNDLQASIGLAQLGRLEVMNARRRQIAERYTSELADLVQTPASHERHTWHLYPIRVEAERRDGIIDYLAERGISTSVHYKPLTHYPMWADLSTPPVTEREWRRLISLPIHAELTDDEQGRVIKALREAVNKREG